MKRFLISLCLAGLLAIFSSRSQAAPGDLDVGFNASATGGAERVNRIVLQSDGKILLEGHFTAVNGTPRLNVARLNADGSLDTAFDPGPDGEVNTIALREDGRILVSGAFTTVNGSDRDLIAQLDEDGTVDGEFEKVPNGTIESHLLNADGSVIIGGFFNSVDAVTRRRSRPARQRSGDAGLDRPGSRSHRMAGRRSLAGDPRGRLRTLHRWQDDLCRTGGRLAHRWRM